MATATTFRYRARDALGRSQDGTLEAGDPRAAASKLREMGLVPLSVEERRAGGLQRELTLPGTRRVKLKDLAVFSRQFATMIGSGLSLLRALSVLAEQTENKALAEIIVDVRDEVETGRSLSDAMAGHEAFPKLYVAMVRAGEAAGNLDEVLLRVAETLEKDVALRGKVKAALTYPVVVLVLAVLLTAVMLVFIVPTFVGMFEELGGTLPLPTRALLLLSGLVRGWWFVLVFVPILAWQGYKQAVKQPVVRARLDALKLRVPVLGPLFHKLALARFTRNLGTLLRAGVSILLALEITADTINNAVVSRATQDVRAGVREGESVAKPLTQHPVFPPMVVQMISVGEESGALDDMLGKVADFYDQEVASATEALTATLEPVMIAVLGGIVGSMVIALYMPMFQIFDLIE
jgi:type IV pilus assembly protein PilC